MLTRPITPGDAMEQYIAELTSVPVLNITLNLTTIRLLYRASRKLLCVVYKSLYYQISIID